MRLRLNMAFYDWKEGYSVGIVSIDKQNRKLICLINEIFESIRDGREELVIPDILRELEQSAAYHFSVEEVLFQKLRYRRLGEHKSHHEHYLREIESLKDQLSSSKRKTSILTYDFLKDWLDNHIQKDDMEFGNFVRESGIHVE